MSRFNNYAVSLDEAFRSARERYRKAYENLAAAEREDKMANVWREEKFVGEREARRLRAKANLTAAREEFNIASRKIWGEFDGRANEIKARLVSAVQEESRANPEAVDMASLELLKTGMLSADDFDGLIDRFAENGTMLKLISRYAATAVESATDSLERGRLHAICVSTQNGTTKTMRAWDNLSTLASYCSGRSRGADRTVSDPTYCIRMADTWEIVAGDAVTRF